jgi:hypothetical protein
VAGDVAEHGVQDVATDVVKVAVAEVALERLLEVSLEVASLVVDTGVGAKVVDNPSALLGTTGDTDDTLGADNVLGKLDSKRADGTVVSPVVLCSCILTLRHR